MAVSHVDTTGNVGGSASATITVPATATAGRLAIVSVGCTSSDAIVPNAAHGWTLIRNQTWFFSSRNSGLYYKILTSSEPATYDFTVGFSNWKVGLSIFDGVDTTTPIPSSNSAGPDNTTSFPTGNVTVAATGSMLLFVGAGDSQGFQMTIPSGMDSRLALNNANDPRTLVHATEDEDAGTVSRTGTTSSNNYYAVYLVAISPSGGAAASAVLSRGVRLPFAILAQ